MSNGVRNLRAMFENGRAAASPEPRGRSPTDHAAASDNQERPKSKVRASFVSVEPTGAHSSTDLGQTKGTASNSVNATRRESFRVSQDKTDELAELKKVVSEKEQRSQSIAMPEAVPEQAVASRESSVPPPSIREEPATDMPNLGSIMKGSDFPDSSSAAAQKEAQVAVPAPAIEEIPVEAAPVPSPEPATAQPAENPDKATTGVQEDVALRPVAPTEEAVVEDDKPALEDAAVDDDAVVAQENTIADEAAVVEEAAIANEVAVEEEAAARNEEPAATQSAENPDEAVTEAQEDLALRPAAPTHGTHGTAVSDAPAAPAPIEVAASSNESAALAESKAKANGTPAIKKPELKKPVAISSAKTTKAPVAPAKSPLPKAAPKTPPKLKTTAPISKPSPAKTTKPVVAPKPAAPKEPVKAPATKAPAAKVPTAKTSRTSLRPAAASSSATAPATAAAAKTKPAAAAPVENKKPAIPKPTTTAPRKSTSPTGFKKPTPKSPTRPVGLPPRLTAPTAASAAKHGEEPKVTRKPSTTTRSAPPKAAAPKTSRPSIAPPAPKRPDSRASTASAASKGGFLERMMRPTAASSSKTHEKPHEKASSPPHKAPAASKPSTLQKGKKKAEEVVHKAKAVVTNGHSEEHKTEDETAKEPEHSEQAPEETTADETGHELEKAVTPVQGVESSAAEIQTPNVQEETIR